MWNCELVLTLLSLVSFVAMTLQNSFTNHLSHGDQPFHQTSVRVFHCRKFSDQIQRELLRKKKICPGGLYNSGYVPLGRGGRDSHPGIYFSNRSPDDLYVALKEVKGVLKNFLYGTPCFNSLFNLPYSKDIHRNHHD